MKQPAAILEARRFVEASMNTKPQNDEPISDCKTNHKTESATKHKISKTRDVYRLSYLLTTLIWLINRSFLG